MLVTIWLLIRLYIVYTYRIIVPIQYISNILKNIVISQNSMHAYGMCRCWQDLIEIGTINSGLII